MERVAERGAALVTALLAAALLALLTAALATLGRQQAERGRLLEQRLLLELRADGALAETLYRLATGQPPLADAGSGEREEGAPGDGETTLRVIDLSGRLNPLSPPLAGLFRRYLEVKGVERERAVAIEAELADWVEGDALRRLNGAVAWDYRSAGLPYVPRGDRHLQDVAELRLLRSMDEALYRRIAPELTLEGFDLLHLDAMPDDLVETLDQALGGALANGDAEAARARLAALRHINEEVILARGTGDTLRIEVEARGEATRVGRWIEVRLRPEVDGGATGGGRPWSVMRWGIR